MRSAASSPTTRSPLRPASSLEALHNPPSVLDGCNLRNAVLRRNQNEATMQQTNDWQKTSAWLWSDSFGAPQAPRAASVMSFNSEMSAATDLSRMSGMTDLTIQTDFTDFNMQPFLDVQRQRMESHRENVEPQPMIDSREESIMKWCDADVWQALRAVADDYNHPQIIEWRYKLIDRLAKASAKLPPPPPDLQLILTKLVGHLVGDFVQNDHSLRLSALSALKTIARVEKWNGAVVGVFRENCRLHGKRKADYLTVLLKYVDHGSAYSLAAVQVLHLLFSDGFIRQHARDEEFIAGFLRYIYHSSDLCPQTASKEMLFAIDCLTRVMNTKRTNSSGGSVEFVKQKGLLYFIQFLDKQNDFSDPSLEKTAPINFLRIERSEEMLTAVIRTLRTVVSWKPAHVEKFVELNGIEVATSWLDHLSNRFLFNIIRLLLSVAYAESIKTKDLGSAIRRMVQFLGTDNLILSQSLVKILSSFCLRSSRHCAALLSAGAVSGLLQLIDKCMQIRASCANDVELLSSLYHTIVVTRFNVHNERPSQLMPDPVTVSTDVDVVLVSMISESLTCLHLICQPTLLVPSVRAMADSPSSLSILLRAATFSFVYNSVSSAKDSIQRTADFKHYFSTQLSATRKFTEMEAKRMAFFVLRNLFSDERMNVSEKKEPLLGESIPRMLWRTIFELVAAIREERRLDQPRIEGRRMDGRKIQVDTRRRIEGMEEVERRQNLRFSHLNCSFEILGDLLKRDAFCRADISRILFARPQKKCNLNPFALLMSIQRASDAMEMEMAKMLFRHLDSLLSTVQAEAEGYSNPLGSWANNQQIWDHVNVLLKHIQASSGPQDQMVAARFFQRFNILVASVQPTISPVLPSPVYPSAMHPTHAVPYLGALPPEVMFHPSPPTAYGGYDEDVGGVGTYPYHVYPY